MKMTPILLQCGNIIVRKLPSNQVNIIGILDITNSGNSLSSQPDSAVRMSSLPITE
jgi:hypothetical protein